MTRAAEVCPHLEAMRAQSELWAPSLPVVIEETDATDCVDTRNIEDTAIQNVGTTTPTNLISDVCNL